jgi:DNA-directed RNA polymerase specialized sigma24 family protein
MHERSPRNGEETRRQQAARSLGDAALITAMRQGDGVAWVEFERRFRPVLDAYAARIGVPPWERDECVVDVLDDTALKLTDGDAPPPSHLGTYLIVSMRHHVWKQARAAARRDRHYHAAATAANGGMPAAGEHVIRTACSEQTVRESAEVWREVDVTPAGSCEVKATPVERLARELVRELSADEQRILAWMAESVPYRQIAEWTGASYDATSKRIQRLVRRLRAAAVTRTATWSDGERAALAGYFSRESDDARSEEAGCRLAAARAARSGSRPSRTSRRQDDHG